MVDGQISALGVHVQNLVGLALNQGQESALIQCLATAVTDARVIAQKLQHVIHSRVQVNILVKKVRDQSYFYAISESLVK